VWGASRDLVVERDAWAAAAASLPKAAEGAPVAGAASSGAASSSSGPSSPWASWRGPQPPQVAGAEHARRDAEWAADARARLDRVADGDFQCGCIVIKGWSTYEDKHELSRDEAAGLAKRVLDLLPPDLQGLLEEPLLYARNFTIRVPLKVPSSLAARRLTATLGPLLRNHGVRLHEKNVFVTEEQSPADQARNRDLGRMAGCLREWLATCKCTEKVVIQWEARSLKVASYVVGTGRAENWAWNWKSLRKVVGDVEDAVLEDLALRSGWG
jgi:hypothetical protein